MHMRSSVYFVDNPCVFVNWLMDTAPAGVDPRKEEALSDFIQRI
jgi:hypothetical protein